MLKAVLENQIVSGGLILVFVGGLIAYLKNIPTRLFNLVKNRLLFTVEIDNNDSAFGWVRGWVASRGKAGYLSAGVTFPPDGSSTYGGPGGSRQERPRFFLCPRGVCLTKFKGKRFLVWVSKEAVQMTTGYRETITIQCWRGNKAIFEELLNDAYDHAARINGDTVEVWIPDGSGWQMTDRKAARKINTLSLAPGVKERTVDDAKAFLARRDWYIETGIPFRRGYLLYGPPGNGKSSLAHALASELRTNINIVNLSAFTDDSQMMSCLARIPKGHVVLLEDVDCVFKARDAQAGIKISFSALLNALDGVCAQEGRILVMTTNQRDSLDSALKRAGRADVHVFVGNATGDQAADLFRKFFPAANGVQSSAFAEVIPDEKVSIAALQECLLGATDAQQALRAAERINQCCDA